MTTTYFYQKYDVFILTSEFPVDVHILKDFIFLKINLILTDFSVKSLWLENPLN